MRQLLHIDPSLKRLYRYFFDYKVKLLVAAIALLCSAGIMSLIAVLLGKVTDAGFYGSETWAIVAMPFVLVLVAVLYAFFAVGSSYMMAAVSQDVLIRIRNELFDAVLHWPTEQYQKHSLGIVSSKFVNEAAMALSGAAESIIILVRDSAQIIALLAVLFWRNWQLSLVTLLIAPVLGLAIHRVSQRVRTIVSQSQTMLGKMISRVQESYVANRLVKLNGTYAFEDHRFDNVNHSIETLSLKTIKYERLITPLTQTLTMVALAFVVWVALVEANQGLLTFGEFVTFITALLLLRDPIQHLSGLNATFAKITAAASSIFAMLDIEAEHDSGKETLVCKTGKIEFKNVSLRYPGEQNDALRNITLTIEPGEHIALVGESGAGKTSLVGLLPRFWEVSSGTIEIDGQNIQNVSLPSLRKQISVVSQSPELIEGSIRNNITYGIENATEEEIRSAIQASGLADWIASLPQGIDTPVGENGGLLSGGQRQRLAIARAFLKNAPILIFDEATSALDSETEALIKDAIESLRKGKTCVTVTHRFSTIEYVNRIAVVENGQIVEIGTLDKLIALNGIFAKLRHMQE